MEASCWSTGIQPETTTDLSAPCWMHWQLVSGGMMAPYSSSCRSSWNAVTSWKTMFCHVRGKGLVKLPADSWMRTRQNKGYFYLCAHKLSTTLRPPSIVSGKHMYTRKATMTSLLAIFLSIGTFLLFLRWWVAAGIWIIQARPSGENMRMVKFKISHS